MAPRFRPPTLAQQGIEAVFTKRKLDLDMFKLLVKAGLDNTAIANALSEKYREKYGIEIHIAAKTVKGYRKLL